MSLGRADLKTRVLIDGIVRGLLCALEPYADKL